MSRNPVVGIVCNINTLRGLPAHTVRNTYVHALRKVVGCTPLLIPALGEGFSLAEIADVVDGLVFTGSPSHIDPARYGHERQFEEKMLDPARDATALPLIKDAIAADLPMLTICRGFQEMNVTLGGTLHQKIHEMPGKRDHRYDPDIPLDKCYERQVHKVAVQKGGLFESWDMPAEFTVNSLHEQAVDALGKGLFVEAISEDGVVEAVSLPGKRFICGVQWHPEGDFHINPASRRIFEAFRDALAAAPQKSSLRA
ncbi:MAG: gamma-glutamyl-gamma-aminobutyrate hydrolase family protein [Alphaproteobacteria bacterium]|nr:gamma-glutamyl-gamma-aminobutyrate hydrolase family protein [Alphaproteobacteria bacterium]